MLISVLCGNVFAQTPAEENLLSAAALEQQQEKQKVTAVYGVTADDYLPSKQSTAVVQYSAKPRAAASHPAFVLPESFFLGHNSPKF